MSGYLLDLGELRARRPDVHSAILALLEVETTAAFVRGYDQAMLEATGVRALTDDEHRRLWRAVAQHHREVAT